MIDISIKYLIGTGYPKTSFVFYMKNMKEDRMLFRLEGLIDKKHAVLHINKHTSNIHGMLWLGGVLYSVDMMRGLQLNPKDIFLKEMGM